MSDRAQNRLLLILGIISAVVTIGVQIGSVGELKGKIDAVITSHEHRLTNLESHRDEASKEISEIKGRLHGIASQVGKVPGRVAAAVKPAGGGNEETRRTNEE